MKNKSIISQVLFEEKLSVNIVAADNPLFFSRKDT